jgi:hypothetical protein
VRVEDFVVAFCAGALLFFILHSSNSTVICTGLDACNAELSTLKNTNLYKENLELQQKVDNSDNILFIVMFFSILIIVSSVFIAYFWINNYQTNTINHQSEELIKLDNQVYKLQVLNEERTEAIDKLKNLLKTRKIVIKVSDLPTKEDENDG